MNIHLKAPGCRGTSMQLAAGLACVGEMAKNVVYEPH